MSVREIDAEEWNKEVLESNMLTVVDFWHEHCPWCIRLEPVLNEVAEEYKGGVKFVKLNVLKNARNREIALRYGIMKEKLKEILDDMLERHEECVRQSTELKI